MLPSSGHCSYHPDRAGIGVCVECRKVICQECTTQFEGINRCASCLNRRLASAKARVVAKDWSVGNTLLALLAFGALFLGVWGVASVLAAP